MDNGKNLNEYFEKIKKLKALADNAGSPEEAANAMARMNEILEKYNIDLHTALNHTPESKEVNYEIWDLNDYQGRHDGNTFRDLIFVLAKFNFCKAVHGTRHSQEYDQGVFTIFGNKMNLEIVAYMRDYCINQMRIMEKSYWAKYRGTEKRGSFRRGFYRGCVNAIIERLQEQQAKQDTQTMAIIRVGNALVEQKFQAYYAGTKVGTVRAKNLISQDGRANGYSAGKSMNLAKGVGGGSSTKGRIG